MDLKNIQKEYRKFLESLSFAESYLEELIEMTNKYLYEYSKSMHCNTYFAENIEINLLYFDSFLERINDILDDIETINIQHLKEPEIYNVVKMDDYLHIPDGYDTDI